MLIEGGIASLALESCEPSLKHTYGNEIVSLNIQFQMQDLSSQFVQTKQNPSR